MKDFNVDRVEAWTRSDTGEGMVSLHTEWRDGEYHLSFYMTAHEFKSIVARCGGAVPDGYHNLLAQGEMWTFYDLDIGRMRLAQGTAEVPYARLRFPYRAQEIVLAWCERIWKERSDARKVRKISARTWDRWRTWYGQGKGSVRLRSGERYDSETRTYSPSMVLPVNNPAAMLETLTRNVGAIAQNTTFDKWETAEVYVSREDETSVYWEVKDPAGRRSMNGCICDRGDRWSIHT